MKHFETKIQKLVIKNNILSNIAKRFETLRNIQKRAYESEGRAFESLWARHKINHLARIEKVPTGVCYQSATKSQKAEGNDLERLFSTVVAAVTFRLLVANGDLGVFWAQFDADLCFKAFRLVSN